MAVDMFLKIDRIPGESTDARHRDEIDVLSYYWGESQPQQPVAQGRTCRQLRTVGVKNRHLLPLDVSRLPALFYPI